MLESLTLKTIGELDGGAAGVIVDAALREAVRDLDDRGEDGKPRKVEVVLTLTKRPNGQVEVEVEAAAKGPRRRTASTVCNMRMNLERRQAELQFSTASAQNPDQKTLDELTDSDSE